MECKSITYSDFRNIQSQKLTFLPGVNVLWGNNGEGKSNMLEGIYFFARGRSFRGAREKEMIRFSSPCARLSLEFIKSGAAHESVLGAEIPANGKKTVTRGGARLDGVREMIGSFRAVLFCPAHLMLVDGGPSVRRSFLDIAVSQLYPAYIDSLSRYNRALTQRNALIKTAQNEKTDPAVWEIYASQMAAAGRDIARRRAAYMERLSASVSSLFSEMTDGGEIPSLVYQSQGDGEDGESRLYDALTGAIDREIRYGATLFGIHKDDIQIKLNSREARVYASQGQRRSIALAMKLAEGELSREICGEYPVFLLDDVLSELDASRRAFVLGKLADRQIIVTSCEPELAGDLSGGGYNLLHVKDGAIADGTQNDAEKENKSTDGDMAE